ncbi:hypothetical protein, partial [Methylobacterium crusticola]
RALPAGQAFGRGARHAPRGGPGDLRAGRRIAGPGFAAGYGGYAAPLGLAPLEGALEPGLVAEPYFRLPRTTELVPPAWGYGTYGIPTIAGIPRQPPAEPVVYVINGPASRAPPGAWPDAPAPARHAGGARVIQVDVPRR